jgi:hypothetical protein
MRAAGDLAIAIVPDLLERVEAGLLDRRAHDGAEAAVHGRPDMVVILEGEADAVDRGQWHQRRQDEAGQGEEFEPAAAHLRQHVGVAAELVVGEDLDLEPPARFLLDARRRLARPHVHGMVDRRVVGIFIGELRGVGAPRQPGHADDGGAGTDKAATRDPGHRRSPPGDVFACRR